MQFKRQSNGQVITLGPWLGGGGEGAIHEFPPDASLVAKVYHANKLKDIDSDKLRVMLTNPPDDSVAKSHRCVSIAWPVDLLLSINGHQQIIGFLMPRVPKQQVRPIHDYYTPKTRREENLGFNYLSLHRTARNFAGAMSALHAKQYVIGDVNESNILVYDTAMVTLVDTDSFQVPDFQQGKVYRCPVGKAEYTPPELQGKTFSDYDRTPEHDLFGLGVLIFQLLMEGMHPFAAVYQGTGEPPPTEKRILTGHFPYGTKKVPYGPAPRAVPFEVLHPRLRELFVYCFEDGHSKPQARPDARTWMKALDEAEKALVSCGVNSEHRYGGHLSDCPWCERKKQLKGIDPFPAMSGGQSNIPVQIPLQPASKPKPVSSPAPTPTPNPTAIPYQPIPTATPTPTSGNIPSTNTTRRTILQWAGFAGGGFIVAVLSQTLWNKLTPSANNPSPSLKTFQFQTVTVNSTGQITNRREEKAKFFTENLGFYITMDMIAIDGGSFVMGSPSTEKERNDNEGPQHKVTVAPFFMGKYEVTQAQWRAVAGLPKVNIDLDSNPSYFKGDDLPVEQVYWYEAVEACARLSRLTGRDYRLPSEAEWEYACRAGTTTPFYFGETITSDLVNFYGSAVYGAAPEGIYRQKTTDVGSFPPNAFGLYDMHGNVWEWCADPWHDSYEGAPTDGSVWDEKNNDNRYQKSADLLTKSRNDDRRRLQRGGSWRNSPRYSRSALRDYFAPDTRNFNYGFRFVCVAAWTK
ncbi:MULTISPECIES: SUMF1/EgtB/PvdO family nonheme iron enzyme [unclassified Microcoleus]|uniref:SUMF1/EgtB/PvdO family nonheme iron enzyme n=1 Tax=unclassified Microcoleus TaxID=2642155 RepID=UPI002FD746D9